MKAVFVKALLFVVLLSSIACSGDEYVEPDAALEVEGIYRGLYLEEGKSLVIGADIEVKRLDKNKISITKANTANTFTPDFQVDIRKLSTSITNDVGTSYIVSFKTPQSANEATTLDFNDEGFKKIFYDAQRLSEIPDLTTGITGDYKGTYVKDGSLPKENVLVKVTKKTNTVVTISPNGEAFPLPFDVDLYVLKEKIGNIEVDQVREVIAEDSKRSITFDKKTNQLFFKNKLTTEGFEGTKQ
jgi:hypothetical protein